MAARGGGPPARLYYDPGCGPCTFFAKVCQRAGRSKLAVLPYDGTSAEVELADLTEEVRYAYAHLLSRDHRSSGAEIMAPLVGLTLGSTAERVAHVPQLDHGLRWIYDRFWNYRRTRGCAAPPSVRVS